MKVFNIEYAKRYFTFEEIRNSCIVPITTNNIGALVQVLEVQCREDGYQPYVDMTNTGVEILPATKAFVKRKTQLSKAAAAIIKNVEGVR